MGNAARQYVEPSNPFRAILDRPFFFADEAPACPCKTCRAQRAIPYACTDCGYVGEPVTFPCECHKWWVGQIKFMETLLTAPEWPSDFKVTRKQIQRRLRHLRTNEPTVPCDHGNGNCSHTARECPVCRQFLTGRSDPEVRHVFAMLRDVRVALAERGLV